MIRFVPKQFTAFNSFQRLAMLLADAIRTLAESPDESYEKVRQLAKAGDQLVHHAFRELDRQMSNYPPREETFRSFILLHRAFDVVEVLAGRMTAYRLQPVPAGVVSLLNDARACADALEPGLETFGEGKPMCDALTAIRDIDRQAADEYVEGLRELFTNEREPARLVQLNEVYGLLKRLSDVFVELFEALETASWKEA